MNPWFCCLKERPREASTTLGVETPVRSFPSRTWDTRAEQPLPLVTDAPRETGPRRCEILGVGIDLVDYEETFAAIQLWRASGSRQFIVTATAADIQLSRDRRTLAASRRAGLSLPDGIGILMAARMLGHAPRGRVTGPELMLRVCDRGRSYGYRHYFYGSTVDVVDRLRRRLGEQYPGLEIAGAFCPPFRDLSAAEDDRIVEAINSRRPDIVWVGLGGTKQIRWMADHAGRIAAPALIGVGAAFNFHSGSVRWAPAWVRRCGMEWAYRIVTEPRKIVPRTRHTVLFMIRAAAQAAAWRILGEPETAAALWHKHVGEGTRSLD
jgi:N-acetylglucosaminyldiphosphoundecaprenol N-acetyl-beta-D-mannosaminyltransferase